MSSSHNRTSSITSITEDTNTKYTHIATIYNDNLKRKYIQKLLKCQAGWLGCSDQIVQLNWRGNASTFETDYLDKGIECFIEANINNQYKSLLDNPLLPYFVRKHHISINPIAIIKLVLKQMPIAF